jgi:hypothetical protein
MKPDSHETLNNWGSMLLEQAKKAPHGQASRLFGEAEEKLREALRYGSVSTYNLACLMALQGRREDAQRLLEAAEHHNTLPDAKHVREDTDLDSLRTEIWFCQLLERQGVTTEHP